MNTICVYTVNTDADWLPYKVKFDCERQSTFGHQYPQLYRDDISSAHDEWETNYIARIDEVVGKPVELYVVAADELGAFAQAVALLTKEGDHN
jgi:hypothetical protein